MVLESTASIAARSEEQQITTLAALARLSRWLCAEFGPTKVILFGSRAKARWHLDSDCDVIAVNDELGSLRLEDRSWAVRDAWDGPVELNPFVLTWQAFEAARAKLGLVAIALAEGYEIAPAT